MFNVISASCYLVIIYWHTTLPFLKSARFPHYFYPFAAQGGLLLCLEALRVLGIHWNHCNSWTLEHSGSSNTCRPNENNATRIWRMVEIYPHLSQDKRILSTVGRSSATTREQPICLQNHFFVSLRMKRKRVYFIRDLSDLWRNISNLRQEQSRIRRLF